jgi:tetratricopeptide (TPR) repeat protein
MTALVIYALAAAFTASVEAAGYLYELLERWSDQVVYNDALGYGHTRMYLGALAHTIGRRDLALEHLEFACRFHEEHGILLYASESHIWLGRALAGQGDTAAAREHFERALELAASTATATSRNAHVR